MKKKRWHRKHNNPDFSSPGTHVARQENNPYKDAKEEKEGRQETHVAVCRARTSSKRSGSKRPLKNNCSNTKNTMPSLFSPTPPLQHPSTSSISHRKKHASYHTKDRKPRLAVRDIQEQVNPKKTATAIQKRTVDVGGNQDSVEHDKRPGTRKREVTTQTKRARGKKERSQRTRMKGGGERSDDRERNKRGKVKMTREKKNELQHKC